MKKQKGFSLIEIIVAIAIIAVLAGALVPVMFNQLDQARYTRVTEDLQAIYEASMGKPAENYFGFVGDVGRLPATTTELTDSTGIGSTWRGPYISLGGSMSLRDVYGSDYVIDQSPIQVRSFGPNKTDDSGLVDDMMYPQNALSTYKGLLEVQVYINGRLITDAAAEQVTADLAYANNGTPASMSLNFSTTDMQFALPSSVHQGNHVLTVVASKSTQDPATTHREQVIILPGGTTRTTVNFEDADYMTRTDTDLNGNGIPDRLEDMDGDGIPDNMDPDIDGDGVPNTIDLDPYDPTVGQGGGGGVVAPIVNSVTPNYGNQGQTNLALTIDGAYFQDSATVTFSGTGVTVLTVPATFNGSSQLLININIDGAAATGLRNVTVNNPDGLSGTGLNLFQILAAGQQPGPIINQVVPDSALQGATDVLVSIQGQNFQPTMQVAFSNPGISIVLSQYVNSSEVLRRINISAGASTGTGTVTVTNPDGQFKQANFKVVAVVPNIAQINPVSSGAGTIWIDVTGSAFLSGIAATKSGTGLTIVSTQYKTSSWVRVRVDIDSVLIGRDVQIILTNPGGGSDQATFHVNGTWIP